MADTMRPPPGEVTNPAVLRSCNSRGWPLSSVSLADAATLDGLPLHVPATADAVEAGLKEINAADRRANNRAAQARDLKKLEGYEGFAPK